MKKNIVPMLVSHKLYCTLTFRDCIYCSVFKLQELQKKSKQQENKDGAGKIINLQKIKKKIVCRGPKCGKQHFKSMRKEQNCQYIDL